MMFPAEVSLQVCHRFGCLGGWFWAMQNGILCMKYELAILAVATIHFTVIRHETQKKLPTKKLEDIASNCRK